MNDTTPTSSPGLAATVLARARSHPSAPALVDGTHRLDYAELAAASASAAGALRAHGVRPGQAVALCLPRSWQLVCVMLGALRLGAVVVPLDSQSPPERRRHILTDSACVLVVYGADGAGDADQLPPGVAQLTVDSLLDSSAGPHGQDHPTPDGTAPSFLFYTSGSTGRPKGVEVRDAGILRLAQPGYLQPVEGARFSCMSNPAFDALSFEVWVPLLTGGCCVILDDETVQTPEVLAAELERLRIDVLFITVALFNAVVDKVPHCFSGIGQVLVGGEQLNARLITRWYRHNSTSETRLHNVYGPTEATTFALLHPIPRDFEGDVVPIGRALPGTGALPVVDGSRVAEPGEVAELHLSGEALAAGYRNLPEETGRRFVTLPWHDGGAHRHYRTGDLVRRDAEGRYTYVERADRQVKVRGFRIEPGELERALTAHPAVRQAYVCTQRDAHGVNELLAHLVLGADLSYDAFEEHLAAGLPAYMRPHRTHLVAELPLNSNGKVDREVLLRDAGAPWRRPGADLPERDAASEITEWQREVLQLAGEITGVEGLRRTDRWIAVGGDSLKALRLRFEVRGRWGVELPQALVLRADFAELAAAIDAGRSQDREDNVSLYPRPAGPAGARSAPATAEQQRLWLLQQQDPASRAYHVPLAFRVGGEVDTHALREALRGLVDRHPALRTAFEAGPGGLCQVVGEPYDPWVDPTPEAVRDEAGRSAFASQLFDTAFDLARGELLRACWLPDSDGGELLLSLHHIAVDGWSLNVLFGDLSDAYAAACAAARGERPQRPEGTPAPTPLDYAAWQTEWFARDAYRAQRTELRSAHAEWAASAGREDQGGPLEPVRALDGDTGRLLLTTLDAGRRAALDRLCGELGLTRFQVLLAVYAWSLYGVTGRTRLRVAAPVANRPVQEFASGVGMFANTVLLPCELEVHERLRPLLRRLGTMSRTVLDHQDVTLADALSDASADGRGGTGESPFDFLFVLENTDFGALTLPGCRVRPRWPEPTAAKCPLTLSVVERTAPADDAASAAGGTGSTLDCLWEYDARYFDAGETAAMAELYRDGLDRLTADTADDPSLAELIAPYREQLPEPGRAAPLRPAFTTVAEGFDRQVRRTPDAPALVTGERTLTYSELDVHAAELAGELSRAHPLPEGDASPRCVALYLQPSDTHVVALLALARLNVTAVPLDPSYPPALLRQILAQVEPLCVLVPPDPDADGPGSTDALDGIAPDSLPRHPVVLAPGATPGAGVPSQRPYQVPYAAHDGLRPLYTLFTSGSTGVPKGVQVPDRTLCNLLQWQQEAGGPAGPAVTQQFSMLSFDVSFQEIFSTLCGGGRLHLVRPQWRQDAPALLDQLEAAGAERIYLPYVALQLLAEHGVRLGRYPSRLREVVTAGEQLLCTDAIRQWFAGLPGARLFNHYGPTETHVVSGLCLAGDPAGWPQRPAIGTPVAGAWLRVVDAADQPVPPGRPGRLLIGGPMAAPCYTGDDRLNQDRFVDLPGLGTFYRSGDLAHFDHEGLLHYRGRDDQQIKLSGHRIELGQIEAALLQHPDIVNAVVVRDDSHAGGVRLVACLQAGDTATGLGHQVLTRHLAPLLPSYVRVERFRILERLPLTPSGKLDRRAVLAAPGEELHPRAAATPARRALSVREARLTELFEEVLGLPVGPDERFFDAGASSLGLMRFHLRGTAEPDLNFSIPDLFEHVTIRRLAAFLDSQHHIPARLIDEPSPAADDLGSASEPIAVVGMAVRVPGADDLAAFWELIRTGSRGIDHFEAAEGLVGARSQMSELLSFDPEHFGISRQEARLMDPQQRHLLMSCVQALAHAGIAPSGGLDRPDGQSARGARVGLVAGCGENTYLQSLLREADPERLPDGFQLALHHEKDFLTTKVAYHLDLSGPAFTVQAACASSLVAVHVAAGLLRQGDADVMLAGGVLVDTLLTDGYAYRPQHIFSEDGHCRGFSDDASGTVGGSGVGVVVLKPLRLARRDGDTVYAVLTGSALNNDGSGKLSYSAPSLTGQREVIRAALRRSGRTSADLGYVEAHGTGTPLGDPVEVGALRQAFGLSEAGGSGGSGGSGGDRCALASVKSQIGHLGAAAGVVGLVRAVLAVHHGVIPPQVDFRRLNPQIGSDAAPFYIPTEAAPWPAGRPRVAAVSSFGIGGTNAHVVLEAGGDGAEAHTASEEEARAAKTPLCLLLSSSSKEALRADAARVADHLRARPETYDAVLRHLQAGRPRRRWRAAAVCADVAQALAWLRTVADGGTQPKETTGSGPDAASGEVEEAGLRAEAHPPAALVEAWLSARTVHWAAGPAQAPWDFPPPAFALTAYDFERAAAPEGEAPGVRTSGSAWPERVDEADWLHQPHWVRLSRAAVARQVTHQRALLVMMTAEPLPPEVLRPFAAVYDRVVTAVAADGFARLADNAYEVDPADPGSLRQLLETLTGPAGVHGTVDWLHALPLTVRGPVGEGSLALARWACLDTPAALLRAAAELPHPVRLRPWWLSYGAHPVEGPVQRPELGLLAGAAEVAPQECAVDGRWLDLPGDDAADWSPVLAGLLAAAGEDGDGTEATTGHPRLALRQGYWWRQALSPVPVPVTDPATQSVVPSVVPSVAPTVLPSAMPDGPATYVLLGGTGGIGRALAAWLLAESGCRVVLVSRQALLPEELAPWADRVELVEADLAVADPEEVLTLLDRCAPRIDGVVHAVGVAGGGLLARRDPAVLRWTTEAKLRGALLVERLIERHRPGFAVYCSSMSALFGGIGQFDYAAANGALDGFARHSSGADESTLRIALDWDIWREGGMAERALHTDARHQAHLAVGLTAEEGKRLFARALHLQLPQLMVSTTDIEQAPTFYAGPAAPAQESPDAPVVRDDGAADDAAARLSGWLCQWLGLAEEELDPGACLYDYGADSLTMIDLIVKVEEHYGVSLELSQLSHRVSLDELLAHLQVDSPQEEQIALEVWQEGTGADLVCLVHPVGGDIQAYRDLVSALDPALTVCLIADPALRDPAPQHPDGAAGPDAARSLAERARCYHDALQARFPHGEWRWQLAGWSFGAWVAHAMAAEAAAAGRPAEGLHLLDPPPPGSGPRFRSYDEAGIEAVFAHELDQGRDGGQGDRASGQPGPSAGAQAYAERLARCCRANLAAMAEHELPGLKRTPAHLWLASRPVAGLPDPTSPDAQLIAWKGELPLLESCRVLDTTHYGIVRPPHARTIADAVNAAAALPGPVRQGR